MRTSSETTLVSNKTLVIYDWPFSNGFPRRDFREGSSRSSPRGAVSTSHAPSAEGCKLSQVFRDMTTHASSVIPIRCGSPALARRRSSDSCALASWTAQVSLGMAVLLIYRKYRLVWSRLQGLRRLALSPQPVADGAAMAKRGSGSSDTCSGPMAVNGGA